MANDLSLFRTVKKICWQSYAVFQMRHPGMLPKLEETLTAMNKKWRGVLRREQSPIAPK